MLDFLYYEKADLEVIKHAIKVKREYETLRKEKRSKLVSTQRESINTHNNTNKLIRLSNTITQVRTSIA